MHKKTAYCQECGKKRESERSLQKGEKGREASVGDSACLLDAKSRGESGYMGGRDWRERLGRSKGKKKGTYRNSGGRVVVHRN